MTRLAPVELAALKAEHTPREAPSTPITRQHLVDRGFVEGYRKHYRQRFVIDALFHCLRPGVVLLEIRAGSNAFRHELRAESLEELDTLLQMLGRCNEPCPWEP